MTWNTGEKNEEILHFDTLNKHLIQHTKTKNMKYLLFSFVLFFSLSYSFAQMDVPPSGGNPRAKITEEVGITSITIKYSRPDVNKREGKIYGDGNLVTLWFTTNNFITNKNTAPGGPAPMKIPPSLLNMM